MVGRRPTADVSSKHRGASFNVRVYGREEEFVLSALTMVGRLAGFHSRVEERRSSSGTLALRTYVTAETPARAEMCIS